MVIEMERANVQDVASNASSPASCGVVCSVLVDVERVVHPGAPPAVVAQTYFRGGMCI